MKKAVLISLILGFIGIAFVLGLKFVSTQGLKNFSQEKLSISFVSYMSSVQGVQKIQLAEIQAVELIERTSQYSIFWNMLKLPDVVVQARIPVSYSYYIDLSEPIQMEIVDQVMQVQAPALKANPPAADVSAISFEVKKGSLFRNARPAIDEIMKTITPLLNQSAESKKTVVLEKAKEQLALIIKNWMLNNPGSPKVTVINIDFTPSVETGNPK